MSLLKEYFLFCGDALCCVTNLYWFMEKLDLSKELSDRLQRDGEDIKVLLKGFADLVKDLLVESKNVALPGFGKFVAVKTDEHIVIDKETGKRMLYPPKVEVAFEQSSILKAKLAKKGDADE